MNKFTTAQLKAAVIEMNKNTNIDNAAFTLALNELESRMTESEFFRICGVDLLMIKAPNWQEASDKEARRIIKNAERHGKTVDYSLSRMIELGISLKTIRSVYRGA